MKPAAKTASILTFGLFGSLATAWAAGARDLWTQAHGNAASTGAAPCANVVPPLEEAWRTPPTGTTDAGTRVPVPFRGKVYIASGAAGLLSIDQDSSLTAWAHTVPGETFTATPACVAHQGISYVFAASRVDAQTGRIYALREDADRGTVMWSRTLPGRPLPGGSLTYANRRLYLVVTRGANLTDVLALDARNGNTIYTYRGGTLDFGTRVTVDPSTDFAYVAAWDSNQDIHALDANGNPAWVRTSNVHPDIPMALDAPGRRLLACGLAPNNSLRCLDADTGALLWDSVDAGLRSSTVFQQGIAVAEGRVHFRTSDDRTAALDLASGSLLWISPLQGDHMIATGNGVLYVKDGWNSRFYALVAATGATLLDLPAGSTLNGFGCEDRALFFTDGPYADRLVKLQGR